MTLTGEYPSRGRVAWRESGGAARVVPSAYKKTLVVKVLPVRNPSLDGGDADSGKAEDARSAPVLLGLAAIGWLAILVCVFV